MKNINIIFKRALYYSIGALLLASCSDNEQNYDKSELNKPTVSVSSVSSVSEGRDFVITLALDHPYKEEVSYVLSIADGSTAVDKEDFELTKNDESGEGLDHYLNSDYSSVQPFEMGDPDKLTYGIVFAPNQTTFEIKLSAIQDNMVEEDEKVTFKLTPRGNFNGLVDATASEFTIDVFSFNDTPINFTFDWNKPLPGEGLENFDVYYTKFDMDFYFTKTDASGIFPPEGETGSDYPEKGIVRLEDYDLNTDYHIYASLASAGSLGDYELPEFSIPATITYEREGTTLNGSYVQPEAYAATNNSEADGGTGTSNFYIATFKIDSNGVVTIFDKNDGSTIATGKNVKVNPKQKL